MTKSKPRYHEIKNNHLHISVDKKQYKAFNNFVADNPTNKIQLKTEEIPFRTVGGYDGGKGLTISGMGNDTVYWLIVPCGDWENIKIEFKKYIKSINKKGAKS